MGFATIFNLWIISFNVHAIYNMHKKKNYASLILTRQGRHQLINLLAIYEKYNSKEKGTET